MNESTKKRIHHDIKQQIALVARKVLQDLCPALLEMHVSVGYSHDDQHQKYR